MSDTSAAPAARRAKPAAANDAAKIELANRLFFRLYQCANMMHKTGTRAVEGSGLTTQQWAVLGALSRPAAREGMPVGELARYLLVSRQNLAGVIGRLERSGHLRSSRDDRDGRSRRIALTPSGREHWHRRALPQIQRYYREALADFSINDATHTLHYLLRLLDNLKGVDAGHAAAPAADPPNAAPTVATRPRRRR